MNPLVEKTILIDDSDIDLFIQKRFLEVYQFSRELSQYKSAREALVWLQSSATEAPDLIFLDLNMPDVDGFLFLEHFQQLPADIKSKVKIVVLTSSNSLQDKENAFRYANVVHFITKPIKQSDLEELKVRLMK